MSSSSCVCSSPGPGYPGVPPPISSHLPRKASCSCLGSRGFLRVGKGMEPWGWGCVHCCINLHKQDTTDTPCYLQFSASTSPAPAKAAFVFLETTILQLNFTKMTSHTSEKNV